MKSPKLVKDCRRIRLALDAMQTDAANIQNALTMPHRTEEAQETIDLRNMQWHTATQIVSAIMEARHLLHVLGSSLKADGECQTCGGYYYRAGQYYRDNRPACTCERAHPEPVPQRLEDHRAEFNRQFEEWQGDSKDGNVGKD